MTGHRGRGPASFGVVVAVLALLVVAAGVWRAGTIRTTAGVPATIASGGAAAVTDGCCPKKVITQALQERFDRERPSEPEPRSAPTGELTVVAGRSPVVGSGSAHRYAVEVEEGLPIDHAAFARHVERVLANRRGWIGGGAVGFRRVSSGAVAFRVTLASPETTDRLCAPLLTNGIFSCFMDGRAVLNFRRWKTGSGAYAGDLQSYRIYMINHEVGHAIGRGHTACHGAGLRAPVMMQQSKGLLDCRANPWPLSWERP